MPLAQEEVDQFVQLATKLISDTTALAASTKYDEASMASIRRLRIILQALNAAVQSISMIPSLPPISPMAAPPPPTPSATPPLSSTH